MVCELLVSASVAQSGSETLVAYRWSVALMTGVGERVVEEVERSLAVTNAQLECFARFGVVNLDRDMAIIGVPEQPNLKAVGAPTV
jgi:hypothetical protein